MHRFYLLISFLLIFHIVKAQIVEEIGQACNSDIREAKEKALKDAKVKAVEKNIGTFVDTKTLLINGKLVRDIIQSRALGSLKLYGKPIILEKYFSQNESVCVKLKAKFKISNFSLKPARFGLTLFLNKKEFSSGENLQIKISSEKPCYPYLFSVDAKQKVYLLLPNPLEDTFLLRGSYTFPSERLRSKGFYITVYPLPDTKLPQYEEVVFVCTKNKVKAFEEYFISAFTTNPEQLKKAFNRSYTETLDIFNQIINQIGIENFDIMSEYYRITK